MRTARFVARKQWIVCGSDDMFIRVYNYNTSELVRNGRGLQASEHAKTSFHAHLRKGMLCPCSDRRSVGCSSFLLASCLAPQVKGFEAHTDYIRSIAVHPTLPYILTSSDDMLIKLWDWDKGWICTQIFEGHSHYVMQASALPCAPAAQSLSHDDTPALAAHQRLPCLVRGLLCVASARTGEPSLQSARARAFALRRAALRQQCSTAADRTAKSACEAVRQRAADAP